MFFFLLASNALGQQNLILNGDFEEYWECPTNLTEIEKCKYVYNPLNYPPPAWSSTSDYFNSCSSNSLISTPNNTFGFQDPRSGYGYVGFGNSKTATAYYNEYIQLELSEKLKKSIKYKIEVFVNLASHSEYTHSNVHFKFVEDNLDYLDYFSEFMIPDFKNVNLITDTIGWTKIEFEHIALGNEKYLIIGNFDTGINTNFEFLYDLPGINNNFWNYFYLDDASIIEIDIPIIFPNVFTPNNDQINDVFGIIQGVEQVDKIIITNRWGNIVYESSKFNFSWDGKDLKGNNIEDGVYFVKIEPKYFIEEKKEQYQGMVHLIR